MRAARKKLGDPYWTRAQAGRLLPLPLVGRRIRLRLGTVRATGWPRRKNDVV